MKIKTVEMNCGGESYTLTVSFHKKTGKFVCILPGTIAVIAQKPSIECDTIADLDRALIDVNKKAIEASIICKKIIRFKFRARWETLYSNGSTMNDLNTWEGPDLPKGYRLELAYSVQYAAICNGAYRFFLSEAEMDRWMYSAVDQFRGVINGRNEGEIIIDWSPEREQFFKEMMAGYRVLLDKITTFIDISDEEGIEYLIDNRMVSLGLPKPGEDP